MIYSVLDTNILLLDANNIFTQKGVVVLPEVVIDELDDKKKLSNELGYQARQFGRLLSKADLVQVNKNKNDDVMTVLNLDGTIIHVVSLNKYNVEDNTSYTNDRKIIQVAQLYTEDYVKGFKPVDITSDTSTAFISNDVMARLRALSVGCATKAYNVVQELEFQFTRTIDVPYEIFCNINKKPVLEIVPDHKQGTFNYVFTSKDLTAQEKLCYLENGLIKVIGPETEAALRKQYVNPANTQQQFLSRAIQDKSIDFVICEALAGSGKTLVSLSNAIKEVKLGHYAGITYIRHSVDDVPKEEEVGFLSGNEEKFAVYLSPLYDSLDFIAREELKKSKLKSKELEERIDEYTQKLINECSIEAMTALGLRRRTFNNRVIIIDEAQNASPSSMQKTLTRVGKNCKVIIIGSNRQIDNPYTTKFTNGLSLLLDACTKEQSLINMVAVDLHKVVRSKTAEFAEKLYSKELND